MSFLDPAGTCPYCGVAVRVGPLAAFAVDDAGGTRCATRQPGDTRVFVLHGWPPNPKPFGPRGVDLTQVP